ncbi:isopenicillin N synthase family dioxygenase [Aspergillus clavatus NRRL 1]|uniref:2OG-Fe(II) oxygenase family oxidoreductase, putative n=1 Tax=Aspergillus clavatus (strain ATCC 1007 / CBS 513.65 / DSM 816 / NCTC 3887 / NRRL 1 / QM 1276 / 107) TaxID=344612 RepID=A1CDX0_ASPCL|nr:2OG-Fe(II) oxygenase family oxidoreductase, putative [Aspergillus clavatus NRRL 1]EAW12047.1 2OG-Fe(II) oxygenase family oxidoreductase, putative [Aspergillus clavatus NRRL 1]
MTVSTPSFYLPLVDITPFLEDPSSPAGQQVITDVRRACQSTGFFQMKGHGVPLTLQKAILAASGKFFGLPLETKLALDARKNVGFRGYDVMETQSYELEFGGRPGDEGSAVRDIKEGFFISTDLPLDHPRVREGRFLQGPNVWPPTELLAPQDFRAVLEEYFSEMQRLSRVVLSLVAATLPYGPQVFDALDTNDPMCLLRLLHYPPNGEQAARDKGQLGSGAHTDFGVLTLLLQDGHSGLEVQDYTTREWHGVPPQEDVYIVNMADLMSVMTSGEYKSSWHRVLNRNSQDRYSVVFFYDGNLDYELKPLDPAKRAEEESAPAITIEEHVRLRLTSSYSLAQK